ncbi:PREDICTED: uncharacterized protein LOC108360059 [Rhagoletis zephyria]|uniref:uncharacterized protein LOC108360059 n=1 Tax=Rhagoletis zephyria TaxID=28612 RepID=UPI0008112449|nr:PREDICTED: uncharacterized protein LOC108360059 [Rhagoletis zephyria]XP_017467692.1 PREDICTED: uncharacterized protein LOC108360059 [Rhagoletis zephyria]
MRISVKSVSGLLVLLILALICHLTEVDAAPYQELPPRPGHIPVYIREGNQPLSEIHPGLAEAFHELEQLDQKAAVTNSETSNIVKDQADGIKDQKDTSALINALRLPESDIASLDEVINAEDKAEDEE